MGATSTLFHLTSSLSLIGTLIWLRRNRQVGLYDRKLTFHDPDCPYFYCTPMTKYFSRIAILKRFLKFEYWLRSASKILYRWQEKSMNFAVSCKLWPAFACSITTLCKSLFWVEIHQREETAMCRVMFPYLEILDQFLDLPVLRRQICVTLWTALWLLFLFLTLRWTLTENVHWHTSCWGLTVQGGKKADKSTLLTPRSTKVLDSGTTAQHTARQRDGISYHEIYFPVFQMEKQLSHPTQGDPLRIMKFKCQVWTSSESKQQENKDWNNIMTGLESSSNAEQRYLCGLRCKQKCRWLFNVARATWITVSWKPGAVEQWNLVHVQMRPSRDSSHVRTNSISRGAHYQRKAADMREPFPGSAMINTRNKTCVKLPGQHTVLVGVQSWLWPSERTLGPLLNQPKNAISGQWLESNVSIYCASSLYTLADASMETDEELVLPRAGGKKIFFLRSCSAQ